MIIVALLLYPDLGLALSEYKQWRNYSTQAYTFTHSLHTIYYYTTFAKCCDTSAAMR